MIDTPRFKELQTKLSAEEDEKGRINILLMMAEEIKSFDVDEAIGIANDVIARSRGISYLTGLGQGFCLKGFCNRIKGEYEQGLEVLNDALNMAARIHDRNMEATALYYLGNIYRDLGDLANVLSHYERALAINQELGDEYYQSVILSSISNLLFDVNDYDSALEYALKCLPIFQRVDNVNSLLNIHNTLGNIYFKRQQYAEALESFTENLNRSEPGTSAYIMAESGMGKVCYKMKHFDKAKKYLSGALMLSQEFGNAEVQIICNFYLANLYMDEDKDKEALENLKVAYDMATEYMRRQDLMSIHELFSTLYEKMGDTAKAFKHIKQFEQLKDEIFKQKIINELKNLQVRQQIELAKKEKEVAERTAQLKHQFMTNMSHEIRTPMNAIVGMTRLLLTKDPKPEHLRYLNAIRMSADNLLVIINDILDFSKIEAGKIVIEHVDFHIGEVLQSIRDMLLPKVEEKGLQLKIDIGPGIPDRITGDPTRLNQVLINLAGNAVKFTGHGSIEIKTSLQNKEGNKLWILFEVSDTGIGIAPQYIDTIFDSFTQAGSDITRKFGGTGLGLSISKQLVGLMGGDILVQSELNKGTTFSFTIAFDEPEKQYESEKAGVLDDKAMKKLNMLKVLLVEDNEFNRMVAEDTLTETLPGLSVQLAVDGADALAKLRAEQFDLVLMDIQMPVMDGLDATKMIRSTLAGPAQKVKIIAMTANVMQEDIQHYFDIGMDAYVSKPFQVEELLLKMDAVMKGVAPINNSSQSKANTARPEAAPRQFSVTDMQFLKQFTAGNPEKLRKYINMFLDNAPTVLERLELALNTQDFPTVKICAHSLKPQLNYMGVKEEISKILMIEQLAGEQPSTGSLAPMISNLKQVCGQAFEELRKNLSQL